MFGVIALNRAGLAAPSCVAVRFLDLLNELPGLAGGATLKILPVADPVALEGESCETTVNPFMASQHVSAGFHGLACDGLLEIRSSPGAKTWLEGNTTPRMLRAISELRSQARNRSAADDCSVLSHVYLKRVTSGQRWDLQLHIPELDLSEDSIAALARIVAGIFTAHSALAPPVG